MFFRTFDAKDLRQPNMDRSVGNVMVIFMRSK